MITPADLAQIVAAVQAQTPATVGQGFPDTIATVFQAADFQINPKGAFFYSGTPAAGNLILSVAPGTGTDSYGNKYLPGTVSYATLGGTAYAVQLLGGAAGDVQIVFYSAPSTAGPWTGGGSLVFNGSDFGVNTQVGNLQLYAAGNVEVKVPLQLDGIAAPASVAGDAVLFANTNGNAEVVAADGGTYQIQRATVFNTGTQSISSTTQLTNGAVTVGALSYRFRAYGSFHGPSGGTAIFSFTMPATSAAIGWGTFYGPGVTSVSYLKTTNTVGPFTSPAITSTSQGF